MYLLHNVPRKLGQKKKEKFMVRLLGKKKQTFCTNKWKKIENVQFTQNSYTYEQLNNLFIYKEGGGDTILYV